MFTLKIEKNVPAPKYEYRPYKKYNWEDLEIGDSFVVTGKKERMVARTSFISFMKRNSHLFPGDVVLISRSIGNDQYRFWLVKKD
ncbi:hypothetical protein EBZ80_21230 [bacterium]|jgi:hypothetical protein|nr:hypothetical protein [bacterium]